MCVSVRWVTLWVRPPPVDICVSVRWVTFCGCVPPCVSIQGQKMCVSVRWITFVCSFVRLWAQKIWISYIALLIITGPLPTYQTLSGACLVVSGGVCSMSGGV